MHIVLTKLINLAYRKGLFLFELT